MLPLCHVLLRVVVLEQDAVLFNVHVRPEHPAANALEDIYVEIEYVDFLFELDYFLKTLRKKQFKRYFNISCRKLKTRSYLIGKLISKLLIRSCFGPLIVIIK